MTDVSPGILDGAHLGLPHPVLDLGECLLDGIEIRRVGRQIPEPGVGGADHLAYRSGLVGAEVVHDNNVAGFEDRYELLLDIGAKALAIDRPVEHARRRQPVAAQRAEEGQRAPVTVRGEAAQALALLPPTAQRRHVGLDPRLIDEHQPPWIEIPLKGAPAPPPADDVGAGLLKGEQRFF